MIMSKKMNGWCVVSNIGHIALLQQIQKMACHVIESNRNINMFTCRSYIPCNITAILISH